MWEYGYGKFEDEIISNFQGKILDYNRAEELLILGADLNAKSSNPHQKDNMLAEILLGFWETGCEYHFNNRCEGKECENCTDCLSIDEVGRKMISVVKFFLNHGFDVSLDDYRYGAQCLHALTLSTFDQYILPCVKLLLNAGAKNISIWENESDTVLDVISIDASYNRCQKDMPTANLFEAYYQIILAKCEGRPYEGIDYFESAIGRKIISVYATPNESHSVFYDIDFASSKHTNCFNGNLYFVYDGGYLVSAEYGYLWTDTAPLPESLVDISSFFSGICGSVIHTIDFGYNDLVIGSSSYVRPITKLYFSSGKTLNLSINFGEVSEENRCAYFSVSCSDDI